MNTILPGDHLIIKREFGEIPRGTVVMFRYPEGSERYVSRVIGLPGETIQVRGRSVCINGLELPEEKVLVRIDDDWADSAKLEEKSTQGSGPYRVYYIHTDEEMATVDPAGDFGVAAPLHIPEGQYFLMGDNRENSEDSRYRGLVPRELIWGRASMVYYSAFRERSTGKETTRDERTFTKIH